jgi:hypothetical protein
MRQGLSDMDNPGKRPHLLLHAVNFRLTLLRTQLQFATLPNLIATEGNISSIPQRFSYQLNYPNPERFMPV